MDATKIVPDLIYPYDVRLFPARIPLSRVDEPPYAVLCINSEWAGHLSGLCERLRYRDAWQGTDNEIERAIEDVERLVSYFGNIRDYCEPEFNLRQVDCTLQQQAPDGTWQDAFSFGQDFQEALGCAVNRVKVSQYDPVAGYLAEKLIAGDNVELTTLVGETLQVSSTGVQTVEVAITPASDFLTLVKLLKPDALVLSVECAIVTAFDGSFSLSVGTASNPQSLMATDQNAPAYPNTYFNQCNVRYSELTGIYVNITRLGVTQGEARVILSYKE